MSLTAIERTTATHPQLGDPAHAAIDAIEAAAEELAGATERESTLEGESVTLRAEIAADLLGQDNPDTGKPHSATSAKEAAALDTEYRAHRLRCISAAAETIRARGRYEAAVLRAKLAVGG